MKLTVGIPHYQDYEGAFFTIQNLKLQIEAEKLWDDVEILVVDNSPDNEKFSKPLKQLVEPNKKTSIRYIPFSETQGPANTKERVMQEALGEYVLCIDCHILLPPNSLTKLIEYYENAEEKDNLIQGPLLYGRIDLSSTHFDKVWRGDMYGIWATAWKSPEGRLLSTDLKVSGSVPYLSLIDLMTREVIIEEACQYNDQAEYLADNGYINMADQDDPFEIPAQGMGLFSCRKESWLGFNEDFRGFGGEEVYIHDKYRAAGRKCLCLPFLKWSHRFTRVDGVPYNVNLHDRIRNYVIGHTELDQPLDGIYDNFVKTNKYSQYEWDRLVNNPLAAIKSIQEMPKLPVGNNKLEQPPVALTDPVSLMSWLKTVKRNDVENHLEFIQEHTKGCESIVEISRRRETSVPLLANKPKKLVSYLTEKDVLIDHLQQDVAFKGETLWNIQYDKPTLEAIGNFSFEKADVLLIHSIPLTGMLTSHLESYADKVDKIILTGLQSLLKPIKEGGTSWAGEFKAWHKNNPEWVVTAHKTDYLGITVLERNPKEVPEYPILPTPPDFGAGVELKKLLKKIGIEPKKNCKCNERAIIMNQKGVKWCNDNLETIVDWLQEEHQRQQVKIPFVRFAAKQIVKLAIRRARKNEQ